MYCSYFKTAVYIVYLLTGCLDCRFLDLILFINNLFAGSFYADI